MTTRRYDEHEALCPKEQRRRALAVATIADEYAFEEEVECECDEIEATRRLERRRDDFARAAGRAIARRGY